MQRQRGELVPIGDALGPVKSIRDDSPQARRGFTVPRRGGLGYTPRLLKSSEAVNRWFSTGLCDAAQFSTSKVKTP